MYQSLLLGRKYLSISTSVDKHDGMGKIDVEKLPRKENKMLKEQK